LQNQHVERALDQFALKRRCASFWHKRLPVIILQKIIYGSIRLRQPHMKALDVDMWLSLESSQKTVYGEPVYWVDRRSMPRSFSEALAGIVLPDADARQVRLGSLWESQPAVLVFLRHYG